MSTMKAEEKFSSKPIKLASAELFALSTSFKIVIFSIIPFEI